MPSGFDHAASEVFIKVARQRQLLSVDQANTLLAQSTDQSVNSAQLAVEAGMLNPVEVEVVNAFTAPKDLAPGYELLDVLGYGALGVVYRARQPHLRRDVAIKAIMQGRLSHQNVIARFEQEGAAIGRLHHPNIVSAFDSGSHKNRVYLVMELVKGIDLRQRLDRGPISVATTLSIARQAALGLAHALSRETIHRDIKPGNLILTDAPAGYDLPEGVPLVKIADFGLARFTSAAETEQQDTRLTLTGAALGTPMYCAPEQLSGDEVDHRADIYALGSTLFRMLTGEAPYAATKVSKIIAAKITGETPRYEMLPDELDPRVKALLSDMLQSDPEARLPDYETLISRIDQIQQGDSEAASSRAETKVTSRPKGGAGRRRWPLVASFCVLVAALAAGAFAPSLFNRQAEPTMVASRWQEFLFDGKTITDWSVRKGGWRDGEDAEKGRVLVGKGVIVRELPLPSGADGGPAAYGVRVRIDLLDAEAAEVHFGLGATDGKDEARYVVRYTRESVQLGTRKGVDAEFIAQAPAVPIRSDVGEGPNYHEVRFELHEDHWFVFFDDDLVGDAAMRQVQDRPMIQLVAPGASVHFEAPTVFGLTQAQQTSG